MAVLKINSTNDKLSWLLNKNPSSGVQTKKIRQGTGYVWFSSENEFCMYFKDGDDVDSFGGGDFEYLGQSAYSHPLAYLQLINTFLKDTLRGTSGCEDDVGFTHNITLLNVGFKGKSMIQHITKHFGDHVDIKCENTYGNLWDVNVSTDSLSIEDTIGCVIILLFMLCGDEGTRLVKFNDDFANKYIGLINKLNMPYFVRYLFCRNFMKSMDVFNKYGKMMCTKDIELLGGDTSLQRLRFVEKVINVGDYPIVDIGCGEGMYALNLPKKSVLPYYAIDVDNDLLEVLSRKVKSRGYDNVKTLHGFESYDKKDMPCDILLVEVIEHMDKDDAIDLIKKALETNFNSMVITTPNRDFNKNYLLDENEFRHDDHKWEINFNEFTDLISSVISDMGLDVKLDFYGVGDSVCGCYTTSAVKITNNLERKNNKIAILTVGPSASGKSTYASKLTKSSLWGEVNRDEIRFKGKAKDWGKYKFTKRNEEYVTKSANELIESLCHEGKNIVISDTNLNQVKREKLVKKLSDKGYYVEVLSDMFDVEFEELIQRDNNRKGTVGYEVLLSQYIKYKRYMGVEKYSPDESKTKTVIVDIDGTIAIRGDRSPYDMTRVDEDEPDQLIVDIVCELYSLGYNIVFLSGRCVDAADKTRKWLSDNVGEFTDGCMLLMRENGDSRKDYKVKMELFDKYIRNNYNVVRVIDDRKQVIEECWDVLGIPVMNVGKSCERF